MAPVTNARVVFAAHPEGYPEPGKNIIHDKTETIDPDTVPLNGGFLVKTLDISIDPFILGRMRRPPPGRRSHIPRYEIGKPMNGYALGVVIRSEHPDVKVGDHVEGFLEYTNYSIKQNLNALRILDNVHNIPWTAYLSVLGMPGKTASCGWKEYSHAKKGQTVFITTAAGAVGSVVVQLAKMDGLKVIASAGSDEKVKFLKDIGADVAFNYKTTKTTEVLEKEGPIDIYWDHVGGEVLDAALDAANPRAQFIICGMASGYNNNGLTQVTKLFQLVPKSINMQGFNYVVAQLEQKYTEEFMKNISPLVASGQIKYREAIWNGLESVGDALVAVLNGANEGKAIVHVADE